MFEPMVFNELILQKIICRFTSICFSEHVQLNAYKDERYDGEQACYEIYYHFTRSATMMCKYALKFIKDEEVILEYLLRGLFHDAGKLTPEIIPLWSKPKKLNESELLKVRSIHVSTEAISYGLKLLGVLDLPDYLWNAALNHHRNINGSGYSQDPEPHLSEPDRLLNIVDKVEAIMSDIRYREQEEEDKNRVKTPEEIAEEELKKANPLLYAHDQIGKDAKAGKVEWLLYKKLFACLFNVKPVNPVYLPPIIGNALRGVNIFDLDYSGLVE